ncbi:MAG TPA: hypothetical protein VGF45_01755 [Polyangia bacterium]
MSSSKLSVAGATALALATGTDARAHHVIAERGISGVMPSTVVAMDWTAATFDLPARRGQWQLVTPSFEWQVWRRLSLFAALPFGRVAIDGTADRVGLGDLSVSAKATVFASDHGGLLVSAGLGLELPTGNADHGFGGGHLELTPFLAAASTLLEGAGRALFLYGLGSFRGSLAGPHDDGHPHVHGSGHDHGHVTSGSVVAPHATREVYGRLMLGALFGRFDFATGVEGAAVVTGDGRGHLGWRSEVGHLWTQSLRLTGSVDVGISGEERYGVRGRLGVAWMF